MESTTAGTSQLKVQVLNDHHCVICVLLWLGYAGGATKSEVCKCAPTCSLLVAVSTDELGLTLLMLHGTPWPRCSVSSTAHCLLNVISFGASSIPPLKRFCSCLPKKPEQGMCALVLCGVRELWTSSHSSLWASSADLQHHDVCSDCLPLLPAAKV